MKDDSMIVSLKTAEAKRVSVPVVDVQKPVPTRFLLLIGAGVLVIGFSGMFYIYRESIVSILPGDTATDKASVAEAVDSVNVREAVTAKAVAEIDDIIERVGKHIRLPKGEEPTVATVSDPLKLKDQSFFANAEVGHKVLIYTKAHKAYLFDVEEDILIEVAPITTDAL